MSFFTRRSLNKLQQAVINADLMLLKKQFNKLDQTLLTGHLFTYHERTCNLPELAIHAGQPLALEHLLKAGCSLEPHQPEPLLYQALQHPQQSLKLMTVLLQAKAPLAYPDSTPQHALFACFKFCPATQLMLHLSRLNEYGANLNQPDTDGNTALLLAMQSEHKPLVQMLINSGAQLPDAIQEGWCSEEIADYARRLTDDIKIRLMMLS